MDSRALSRLSLALLCLLAVIVVACSSAPAAAPSVAQAPAAAAPARSTGGNQAEDGATVSESVKPAAEAPAPAGQQVASAGASDVSPYQTNRKIIKDGQMNLLVQDTDHAIDQASSIAVDSGGYVVSSQSSLQDGYKMATLKMGVPVDQFENVQRQLRSIVLQVLAETTSGQDVTDEYVDQQSRLNNLEATAARVREFLKQATTVEDALKVNQQLSELEGEIEQVKGRMNYLKDRAAFSTLLVNIEPQRPTPTPTPTATPEAWRPGQTFKDASGNLGALLRVLGDGAIWLAVVLGPFVALIVALIVIWRRLRPHRRPTAPPAAPAAPAAPLQPKA